MRRTFTDAVAATVVVSLAGLGQWAGGAGLGRAQPPGGDVSGGGVHVTASVDSIGANPPGDRTPNFLMTFSHAAQMSGDYSVTVEGGRITSGRAVAGFILGCGISVDGGFDVEFDRHQGLIGTISPSVSPPSSPVGPPSVSLGPGVGGTLSVGEGVFGNLGPGQVTVVRTETAFLDAATTFPHRIAFDNAALNVARCASPVSAVPFVTATVSTAQGLAQTTAYGDQFTF
ncbi:MspA family porin [Nocardia sp. NPDC059239]|uniref:MspA family porin n=1 Tax=Nocardia sp. NPDC059239 TaxID=3346785 RepID=UPI0036B4AE46